MPSTAREAFGRGMSCIQMPHFRDGKRASFNLMFGRSRCPDSSASLRHPPTRDLTAQITVHP